MMIQAENPNVLTTYMLHMFAVNLSSMVCLLYLHCRILIIYRFLIIILVTCEIRFFYNQIIDNISIILLILFKHTHLKFVSFCDCFGVTIQTSL